MIYILYVCTDISSIDIEYIKYIKHKQYEYSEEIIEHNHPANIYYDIIYLNNCSNILDKKFIDSYIKLLNKDGIIYINNLTPIITNYIQSLVAISNYQQLELPANKTDINSYNNLIAHFNSHYHIIDNEIDMGIKKQHWIWYVFPTEKPGDSDRHKTFINKFTAKLLTYNKKWMDIHKKINNRLKTNSFIIPSIDEGRIGYFIEYWNEIDLFTSKLDGYLDRLRRIKTYRIY